MRKARVLPEPVLAAARRSAPLRARGMARAWTSVRDSKWEARSPEAVASQRGRSLKFCGIDFVS